MDQRVLLVAVAVVAMAGCATPEAAVSGEVRVLGSWSGGELAAFEAVVEPFTERTGVTVAYVTTRDLRGQLAEQLASGEPPDIAGLEGPAHLRELSAAGTLRDLGGILDLGRYRADVAPTFIDLGTVDGRLTGVFVRSSIKGLLWFSPRVFRLGIPRSWEELGRMALQAAPRAEAQWCVGLASEEASGWPGTDLVEQFLLRTSGRDAYDAWVAGSLPWTSREVRRAFELYGQVVAEGAVHGGPETALATDFRQAGAPLFSDPPGCLFLHQGSFMPAFFAADGHQPGTDFDFFPFPGIEPDARSDGVVIGGGDLFGVLTDDPAAAALMRYLVSDEAQSLWVAQGGGLSVKTSVTGYPDTVTRRAAQLLTAADVFRFDASDQMAGALNAAFWQAILDVTADPHRLDDALAGLESLRLGTGGG
jgi:alpha-glucoside transport system substrate-binding protein